MGALDDWVQLDEAMRISGRSKQTIYRWAQKGTIRTVRPGDVIWYNVRDIRTAKRNTPGRPRKEM